MRNVAVLIRLIVDVLQPFLQLPIAADFVRCDASTFFYECGAQVFVDAQNLARLDRVREQAANDLVIHRGTHDEPALFGAVAGAADQRSRVESRESRAGVVTTFWP